jgi:hypothetical protein
VPPGGLAAEDGTERISTGVAALVDTNVLEDLQHDRLYGTVRAVNPFIDLL